MKKISIIIVIFIIAGATILVNQYVKEKDETAKWKTYTNKEFGFEFKYPNDFEKRFTITTEEKEKTGSDQWARSILQFIEGTELFAEKKVIHTKPVIFFYGHPPVTGITEDQTLLTLMFYNEKLGLQTNVAFSGFSQKTIEQDIQTIGKIASTFKFTK